MTISRHALENLGTRYGQKNNMTVVHLQGSEIEKRMYDMLQQKVTAHISLVDLYKEEIGI